MIDIIEVVQGKDFRIQNSQLPKAQNILSVQLGSLEYAQNFGIDMKLFLSEEFKFQNESFISYIVQVLAQNQISVETVKAAVDTFNLNLMIELKKAEESTSLIER